MSSATQPPVDLGLSLAMAVIASSHAPTVLLDENRMVISASNAFCSAFELDGKTIVGKKFQELGDGEWAIPQLQSLLKATAAGLAAVKDYEFELKRQDRMTRCLVLNAHKLNYGSDNEGRMLLAIADVTEAKIARKMNEDLVRDKGLLMQELQHRVANSLQIIASVLMQSARKVQSDEARGHLHDAHHRVMSIAKVQKQLAVSALERVDLRTYLNHLCESLGASMIHDHDQITINVKSENSTVSADVSISLGLVVTELVINSLKHAFPGGRLGQIDVEYDARGKDWTLSVTDDGVGMPTGKDEATPGLGTSIVQALAHQLEAEVTVVDGDPGTVVSLDHIAPTPENKGTTSSEQVAI